MDEPTMRVLNLGAGVQSTTLLLMSCKGELPKLDAAIFADTQWEPASVYRQLDWLDKVTGCHARLYIPIHRVSMGNIRQDVALNQVRGGEYKPKDDRLYVSLPVYTRHHETGKLGMLRRQCTSDYKIMPILRKIRELAGLKPRQRMPKDVIIEQWYGISADEAHRVKPPRERWLRRVDPLIDLRMTRSSCIDWLNDNYPGVPIARSACIGCPFHSDKEWRELKRNAAEWRDAVEFDRLIRNYGGNQSKMFLHRSCVPLDEVNLDEGQGEFDFGNECDGMCGV